MRRGIISRMQAIRAIEHVADFLKTRWGDAIHNKAKPLSLRAGVLQIEVHSSVIAHELRLHEAEILASLNRCCGGTTATRVRIIIV